MKYIFFGTPEFAAIVLANLIDAGMAPDLLVCNPDRPIGRKKIITPPPTKILAEKHGIKVWQPDALEIDGVGAADFAVVAAYAKIIPAAVLGLFPKGVIGVHPSLLPKYRGSSPIQSVLLDGEKSTGVTLYLLDKKMDHGPIIAQQELKPSISDYRFPNLLKELAALGGDLLVKTLPDFLAGKIIPRPQDESRATYTKKFTGDDAFVSPEIFESALLGKNPAVATLIERKIRALNPEPGIWTTKDGKRLKLLEAETKDGRLVIKKTQTEGEKPRSV